MTRAGFPHSEILGSRFVCQLPEAYRRLLRPSSAPGAKASTLCTYKLDHKRSFKDARVHCAVLKQPTVTTRTPAPTSNQHPSKEKHHHQRFDRTRRSRPRQHPNGLFPQDPTACQADPRRTGELFVPSPQQAAGVLESHRPNEPASSRCSTREHHPSHVRRGRGPGPRTNPMTGPLGARCSLERR